VLGDWTKQMSERRIPRRVMARCQRRMVWWPYS